MHKNFYQLSIGGLQNRTEGRMAEWMTKLQIQKATEVTLRAMNVIREVLLKDIILLENEWPG